MGQISNSVYAGPAPEDGRGILGTQVTYQVGTSGTVAPTGDWMVSIPTVPQGQYLWKRTIVTYTDNTTDISYDVSRQPLDGTDGDNGDTGASIRILPWQTGFTYHYDNSFIDLLVVTNADGTVAGRYLPTETYTSGGDETAPSGDGNMHWIKTNDFNASFLSIIISDQGFINFLQSYILKIMKADGTVTAGISGQGEGAAGWRLWAGAVNPAEGKFRVNELGELIAMLATIYGNLILKGDNALTVIDANGNTKVQILAKAITSLESMTASTVYLSLSSTSNSVTANYSNMHNNNVVNATMTGTLTLNTYNYDIIIPALGLTAHAYKNGTVSGNNISKDVYGYYNVQLVNTSTGASYTVVYESVLMEDGDTSSDVTMSSNSPITLSNIPPGSYVIKITLSAKYEGTADSGVGLSVTVSMNFQSGQIVATPIINTTQIGINGLSSIFDVNNYIYFTSSKIKFLLGLSMMDMTSSGILLQNVLGLTLNPTHVSSSMTLPLNCIYFITHGAIKLTLPSNAPEGKVYMVHVYRGASASTVQTMGSETIYWNGRNSETSVGIDATMHTFIHDASNACWKMTGSSV